MRKYLFFILFLLSYNMYADSYFELDFSIANTGFGINYSSNYDDNNELFIELLSFEFIHKNTNIGIGISPFKYWYNFLWDESAIENEYERISFFNFNVNWNIVHRKNIFFGPFWSINYIFLENSKIIWNNYIFTAGLRFKWSFNLFNNNIFHSFLSSEIGYRNINGINKLHFNLSMDLISLLYALAYNGGYGIINKNNNRRM